MINIYKYTFYRMYTWQLKKFGTIDVPEYKALLIVSIFVFLNILTIVRILYKLSLINVNLVHMPKSASLLFYLAVSVFLFFSFVYKDKFKKIEEEYKGESLKKRNINSILVLLFCIASFYIYAFV